MTKVGKSHSKGTFAGAFGNDEDAPEAVFYARGRVGPDLPLTGCIEEFR
jgi:hypothetical protein